MFWTVLLGLSLACSLVSSETGHNNVPDVTCRLYTRKILRLNMTGKACVNRFPHQIRTTPGLKGKKINFAFEEIPGEFNGIKLSKDVPLLTLSGNNMYTFNKITTEIFKKNHHVQNCFSKGNMVDWCGVLASKVDRNPDIPEIETVWAIDPLPPLAQIKTPLDQLSAGNVITMSTSDRDPILEDVSDVHIKLIPEHNDSRVALVVLEELYGRDYSYHGIRQVPGDCGYEVLTKNPVFTPSSATTLDFSVMTYGPVHYTYGVFSFMIGREYSNVSVTIQGLTSSCVADRHFMYSWVKSADHSFRLNFNQEIDFPYRNQKALFKKKFTQRYSLNRLLGGGKVWEAELEPWTSKLRV